MLPNYAPRSRLQSALIPALFAALLLPSLAQAGGVSGKQAYNSHGQYWHRQPLTGAEIVVRPDALQLQLTLMRIDKDPELALQTLEEAAAKVQAALGEVRGQKTALTWTASHVGVWTDDKGRNATPQVSLTAVVELALPPEADLLQRARWQVSMIKARDSLVEAYPDAKKGVQIQAGNLQVVVSAPDEHRPALLQRWAKQAQEFVTAAQTPGTPLAVVDCKAPGAIYQQFLSLDAVKLTMPLECRVDVVKK